MRSQLSVTLEDAQAIIAAACAKARAEGWLVSVCVLDAGGHLLAFERLDGAPAGSVSAALEKGRTAFLFRAPTRALEEAVAGGRTALLSLPGATLLEGGLPLIAGDALVGAVGVSGARGPQDGEVALAGAGALGPS
jgi:glc operon protein GlcG